MSRIDAVRAAYASHVVWAKTVGHISQDCSESIDRYYKATQADWRYLGASPTMAGLVGEYRGLQQARA